MLKSAAMATDRDNSECVENKDPAEAGSKLNGNGNGCRFT